MLGALTFGAKVAMSWLPNIEPVTLFIMLFAAVFGLKSLYIVFVYVLLEISVYGIGTWNIMYLYVWPLLALAAYWMRKQTHVFPWALLAGVFGLAFGALCAPVDFLLGDFWYVVTKWTAGIGFDILHCAGNFALTLAAFYPLRKLLTRLYALTQ